MAHHRIITRLEMTAPVRHVWSALVQPERWIHGWAAMTDAVALDPGDDDHVGTRHAFRLQAAPLARLDFETEVTRAERPDVIEWTVRGDLEGTASWELDDLDGSLLSSRTSSHRPERHRFAGLALRIGHGPRDRS